MTVLEVLQATTAYFKKHDVESPRLNTEHLLAHVVKRRGEGEPLQHLLGTVEFSGHVFLCDKRAMVPRPETEELVEILKAEIQNPKSKVVDVGTGSGVIALSLAANFPEAHVVAVDVSHEALSLAQENAARLTLGDRVQFLKSHLLENVEGKFDLIVANLPYISAQHRNTLSREVLHDPEVALFAGERGDEILRELIDNGRSHLRAGGMLALEIGPGQSEALLSALAEKNYRDICSKNDYNGVTRFLFARYG
jgi:release factor glutamine methyltransferase